MGDSHPGDGEIVMVRVSIWSDAMRATKQELDAIADALRDTQQNVFNVAARIPGRELDGDTLFDELREECGLFKCEECNTWKDIALETPDRDNCCVECDGG